jgi:hypothetical protein
VCGRALHTGGPGRCNIILGFISINLYAFIDVLKVDKNRMMTPHSSIGRGKKLVYTDHDPLHLIFNNLPLNTKKKAPTEEYTVWNTNKPGGWNVYNELTEDNADLEKLAIADIADTNEFSNKLQKITKKITFKSFGKVTFTNKCKSNKPLEKLYDEKKKNVDDDLIKEVEEQIATLLVEEKKS